MSAQNAPQNNPCGSRRQCASNFKTLGSKVARYRNVLDASIPDVAASTGMDAARLAAIEAGLVEPTGDELLFLADHFRCDFNSFLSSEALSPIEPCERLYRAHGMDFTREDRRAIGDVLYLCETEEFLLRALNRERINVSFVAPGERCIREGEEPAERLRKALGYAEREIPGDVLADFRRAGLHIFCCKLANPQISGVFILHPVAGKCALIHHREDAQKERKERWERWGAALAMAHAIFDADAQACVRFERPGPLSPQEERAQRFASRFALRFLLPPALLAQLPDPRQWSEEDAQYWSRELKVNAATLAMALKEAGLIGEDDAQRLRTLGSRSHERTDCALEPIAQEKERQCKANAWLLVLNDFYDELCFDAFNAGQISVGRLAEALLCESSATWRVRA